MESQYPNATVIVAGDLNIDALEPSPNLLRLTNTILSFNLHNAIQEPKRITDTSSTLIARTKAQ